MPDHVRGEHGWDGPVEILLPGTVHWTRDAKTLAALIQDSAPVGEGQDGGTLKKDLSLRRAGYKRLPEPRAGFNLLVHNSYALIQDVGGDIPERRPSGATNPDASPHPRPSGITVDTEQGAATGERTVRAMRWGAPGGYVFARRASGFHLQGQDYLNKGVQRWLHSRGHLGLELGWKPADGRAA